MTVESHDRVLPIIPRGPGETFPAALRRADHLGRSKFTQYFEGVLPYMQAEGVTRPDRDFWQRIGFPEGELYWNDPEFQGRQRELYDWTLNLRDELSERIRASMSGVTPPDKFQPPEDTVDHVWRTYLKPEMLRMGLDPHGPKAKAWIEADLSFPIGDLTDPQKEGVLLGRSGSNTLPPTTAQEVIQQRTEALKSHERMVRSSSLTPIHPFLERDWSKETSLVRVMDEAEKVEQHLSPSEVIAFRNQYVRPILAKAWEKRGEILNESPLFRIGGVTEEEMLRSHTWPDLLRAMPFGQALPEMFDASLYTISKAAANWGAGHFFWPDVAIRAADWALPGPRFPTVEGYVHRVFPDVDPWAALESGVPYFVGAMRTAGPLGMLRHTTSIGRMVKATRLPSQPKLIDYLNLVSAKIKPSVEAARNLKGVDRNRKLVEMGQLIDDAIQVEGDLINAQLLHKIGAVLLPTRKGALNASRLASQLLKTRVGKGFLMSPKVNAFFTHAPPANLMPHELVMNAVLEKGMFSKLMALGGDMSKWPRYHKLVNETAQMYAVNWGVNLSYGDPRLGTSLIETMVEMAITGGLKYPQLRADWKTHKVLRYLAPEMGLNSHTPDQMLDEMLHRPLFPAADLDKRMKGLANDQVKLNEHADIEAFNPAPVDDAFIQATSKATGIEEDALREIYENPVMRTIYADSERKRKGVIPRTRREKDTVWNLLVQGPISGIARALSFRRYARNPITRQQMNGDTGPVTVNFPHMILEPIISFMRAPEIGNNIAEAVFTHQVAAIMANRTPQEKEVLGQLINQRMYLQKVADTAMLEKQLPPNFYKRLDLPGMGVRTKLDRAAVAQAMKQWDTLMYSRVPGLNDHIQRMTDVHKEVTKHLADTGAGDEFTAMYKGLGVKESQAARLGNDTLSLMAYAYTGLDTNHRLRAAFTPAELAALVKDRMPVVARELAKRLDGVELSEVKQKGRQELVHETLMDVMEGPMEAMARASAGREDLAGWLEGKSARDLTKSYFAFLNQTTSQAGYLPDVHYGLQMSLGPQFVADRVAKRLPELATERVDPAAGWNLAFGYKGGQVPDMLNAMEHVIRNVRQTYYEIGMRDVSRGVLKEETFLRHPMYAHIQATENMRAMEQTRQEMMSEWFQERKRAGWRAIKEPKMTYNQSLTGGHAWDMDMLTHFNHYLHQHYRHMMWDIARRQLAPLDHRLMIDKKLVRRQNWLRLFPGKAQARDPKTLKNQAKLPRIGKDAKGLLRFEVIGRNGKWRPIKVGDRVQAWMDVPIDRVDQMMEMGITEQDLSWLDALPVRTGPGMDNASLQPGMARLVVGVDMRMNEQVPVRALGRELHVESLEAEGIKRGTAWEDIDDKVKIGILRRHQRGLLDAMTSEEGARMAVNKGDDIMPWQVNAGDDTDLQKVWDTWLADTQRHMSQGRLTPINMLGDGLNAVDTKTGQAIRGWSRLEKVLAFHENSVKPSEFAEGLTEADWRSRYSEPGRVMILDDITTKWLLDLDADGLKGFLNTDRYPRVATEAIGRIKEALLLLPAPTWAYQIKNILTDFSKVMMYIPANKWGAVYRHMADSIAEISSYKVDGRISQDILDASMHSVIQTHQVGAEGLGSSSFHAMGQDMMKTLRLRKGDTPDTPELFRRMVDVTEQGMSGEGKARDFLRRYRPESLGEARQILHDRASGTWRQAIRLGTDMSETREMVWRLALYKTLVHESNASGGLLTWGMSNPDWLRGLSREAQAGVVTRRMLVDYRNPSPAAEEMRRFWFPFSIFRESVARQPVMLAENMYRSWKAGEGRFPATQAAVVGLLGIPFGLWAINRQFIPMITGEPPIEDGPRFPEYARHTGYLKGLVWNEELGRWSQLDKYGRPRILAGSLGLSEGLGLYPGLSEIAGLAALGLHKIPGIIEDIIQQGSVYPTPGSPAGRMLGPHQPQITRDLWYQAPKALAKHAVKEVANDIFQLLNPGIQMGLEGISGRKLYPNVFNPRPSGNWARSTIDTLSGSTFTRVYNTIMKHPDRYPQTTQLFGGLEGSKEFLLSEFVPGNAMWNKPDLLMDNYFETLAKRDVWKSMIGEKRSRTERKLMTPLIMYRRHLALGHYEVADYYMREEIQNNPRLLKRLKEMEAADTRNPPGHPLHGMDVREEELYREYLSDEEEDQLNLSIAYFEQDLNAPQARGLLRMWRNKRFKTVWEDPSFVDMLSIEELRAARVQARILAEAGVEFPDEAHETSKVLGPLFLGKDVR